jgi:hypothetical protein
MGQVPFELDVVLEIFASPHSRQPLHMDKC